MSLACIDLDENGLSTAGAFQYDTANLLSISKWTTVNLPGKCCNSAPWKFVHLKQAQNKHLLTFSRQHFFSHFSISKWLTRKQRCKELCVGMQNKSCLCLTSRPVTCVSFPLCWVSTFLVQQVYATLSSSDGGSWRRREAMELCSSSAADVSS